MNEPVDAFVPFVERALDRVDTYEALASGEREDPTVFSGPKWGAARSALDRAD